MKVHAQRDPRRRFWPAPLAAAVALAFTVPVPEALAATNTWTGTGTGPCTNCWHEPVNWSLGLKPATGDAVVLTLGTNFSPGPYDLGSFGGGPNPNLLSITLNSSASYAINPAVPGTDVIVLQSGGSITDNNNNTTGTDSIGTGLTLNGPATITLSTGATGLQLNTNAITGTGGLTLVNNGANDALQLSVANTYTGATVINGTGRVVASVNGAIPTGSALTVNGSVLFNAASTVGSLAGSGRVFINGTNALTVGGDNTSTTFSGVYQDSGGAASLVKTGSGTLVLTGANTYSGGTTVSAGTLQGNTTGLQGNITNNAAVVFDQAANGTYAGIVSGTGSLTKINAGTLTLTGANTYSGGTTVNAGTLQGNTTSLQGNITNNAAVVFDQAANGTYAGIMGGTGSLTKINAGTLTLSGVNTYSGGTTINAGTLAVNGSIASPVTVNSGGTLGGTGTINNSVAVMSGGVLARGNSIGTISVNGSLALNAGSIYRVKVDAAGNADRTNVTGAPGTATVNGGTVDVVQTGAGVQANTRYTILNATGGVTGTFAGVTTNFAFLTPSFSYDANNAYFTLIRNGTSFASVAATSNQRAAATVLQASSAGATGDLSTVLTAVTGLSVPQARAAFDSIGGASFVALRRTGTAFADGFGQQLNRRLGVVASGDAPAQSAAFGAPLQLAASDWMADAQPIYAQAAVPSASGDEASRGGRGFWIRGYGAALNNYGDGNAAASRLLGGGLSGGADKEFGDGLVLGVAASGGKSHVYFPGLSDSGRSRGAGLGGYGSYVSGLWAFKAIAGLARNANHMDRGVVVGGLARTATSDFNSTSQSAYLEATYGHRLQPLAGFSYVRTKTDGFTESGAGALDLQVAGQTTQSARSLLGAKVVEEARNGMKLEQRLLWAHEFGNVNAPMTASLAGAPAAGSFQVSGVALKRDSLVLGLGASGAVAKGINLFADAQAEGNSRQKSLAFFVGARGSW